MLFAEACLERHSEPVQDGMLGKDLDTLFFSFYSPRYKITDLVDKSGSLQSSSQGNQNLQRKEG